MTGQYYIGVLRMYAYQMHAKTTAIVKKSGNVRKASVLGKAAAYYRQNQGHSHDHNVEKTGVVRKASFVSREFVALRMYQEL